MKLLAAFYGEEVEVELFDTFFISPKVLDGDGLISDWPVFRKKKSKFSCLRKVSRKFQHFRNYLKKSIPQKLTLEFSLRPSHSST